MASVDKVRIGTNTYDVSPSGAGTLKPEDFASGDSSTATSWQSVDPITTSDTHATIFSKVTTMVRNIRYLYNKLGTTPYNHPTNDDTVSTALRNLQNNKASSSHSHTTAQLPVSSSQVNSSAYIPTSSLVYSMNETLTSLNDASNLGVDFTTNVSCGGIAAGTELYAGNTLQDIVKNMIRSAPPAPSIEYESKSLGTWSSTTDVENFFSAHNVQNGFAGIKIGNYVTINDDTYDERWVVAGFTCEHNAVASDGTTYDNGIGMLMIPKSDLTTHNWSPRYNMQVPYIDSAIHSYINSDVYNALSTILGNHIVQRNVLLGSECNGSDPRSATTSAYQWTTSYLTLMSIGQMTGTFVSNNNKYDDGEANYKLPLFNYEDFKIGSGFWSRCVWGLNGNYFDAWYVYNDGRINYVGVNGAYGVRPLMLLR